MNKKITLCFLMSLLSAMLLNTNPTIAQTSGGPDTYGYVWRDSNDPNGPTYNWINIVGAPGAVQVSGLADDNLRGPYAIGFPFHFYWYDVTTFRIGSNGYIGFSNTPVAHPFPTIPTSTGIQNYMAIMASDLTFTDASSTPIAGTECWYWTSPTEDTLVVSYINVPFWDAAAGYTGSNTFQIILNKNDSSITYQYEAQIGTYNNPANFVTIGIENNSGNIGLQHSHDVFPVSQYAIKFTYPSIVNFQVSDASTSFVNNESTGGLFLSASGTPYTMTSQVKNTGNQPLSSFNVQSRVINSLNQNQALGTIATNALNPGDTQDLIFSQTFGSTTPGVFRHINNTQLTGDATPSNNQRELELQVVDTTQSSILLSFDTGLDAGLGGLSWSGGGGGAGIQFVPPFTPCNVDQVRVYIAANNNLVGFSVLVLDDDGIDGTPLTVLDSVYVDPANVIVGSWNTVTLNAPIQINSGSFYVAWMMAGDGISVGQNQVTPISNRTFEILGSASNPVAWAAYRYRELEDLMINAYVSKIPVGIAENASSQIVGQPYPNPASNYSNISYELSNQIGQVNYRVLDLNGRLVTNGTWPVRTGKSAWSLDVSRFKNGVYQLEIIAGAETFVRKVSVVR
ncbi:MAG: T9SS type A sorting domain-containing protein [Arcticibacter sp.]